MQKYIRQLEIPMHNLVLNQGLKPREYLTQVPDDRILLESFLLLHFAEHIPTITILQNQVVVVSSLFQGVELHDVRIVAGLEHLDLIF